MTQLVPLLVRSDPVSVLEMLKRFAVLKKTRCRIVTLLNKYACIALASLLPSQKDEYKSIA
jgi:hypothetical protein